MEPLLGMPAGWLPRDSAQLDAYMRDMLAGETPRRDRHQPHARASRAVPAAVVRGLAGVSGDAAAHDRIAAAIDPPGLRVRVARARRAGVRALDGAAANVAATAAAARAPLAGGSCQEHEGRRSLRGSLPFVNRVDPENMVKKKTWLLLLVVPPFLIGLFVVGLFLYVNATARPLHPDRKRRAVGDPVVPVPPRGPARWSRGGSSVVRASSEQNLPGLSVAVGVGGEIVWAEGFGWADLEKRCRSRQVCGSGPEASRCRSRLPQSACCSRRKSCTSTPRFRPTYRRSRTNSGR